MDHTKDHAKDHTKVCITFGTVEDLAPPWLMRTRYIPPIPPWFSHTRYRSIRC